MTTDRDAPILPECGDGDFSLGRDNVPWREKTERDKIEEKYKGTDRMMKVPNGMAANPSKDYDSIIASTGTSREMRESLEYALSPANQIKSADRNSGVFSFKDGYSIFLLTCCFFEAQNWTNITVNVVVCLIEMNLKVFKSTNLY